MEIGAQAFYVCAMKTGALLPASISSGGTMSEDAFNMSMRKFLKQVGVTSQREIEKLVQAGGGSGGKLKLKMTLTAEGTSLEHVVKGEIELP